MSSLKILLAAASIAAFVAPAAFAQSAPPSDGAPQQHGWHMPTPEQRAAWHTQMCKSRYARAAGKLAYLQADLSITDAQRGAFDEWKNVVLSSAKAHSDACLAHAADGKQRMHHDALERNARMQKMLEGKLAELKAERPALESLYASLTPDQKKLFDRAQAFGHGRHGHHMGHMDGQRFGHDGGWQQRAPG
jgi:periplasmic protein CpxP/Spy